MLRGIYTSASGLTAVQKESDVVANNLANVNTVGFKKAEVVKKSFAKTLLACVDYQKEFTASPKKLIGNLGKGVKVDDITTYHQQGSIRNTGRDLDIALIGSGYLIAQDQEGRELYTRNGSLSVNKQGELVNDNGDLILGQNGAIKIDVQNITINDQGQIYADGEYLDKFKLVSIENPRKIGNHLYTGSNPQTHQDIEIKQGYLEDSNVNPVDEMVKMINIHRSYEANQKMIQTYDTTLGKAVNEIANT